MVVTSLPRLAAASRALSPKQKEHQADRKKHVFEVADSVEPEDAEQLR